MTSKESYPFVDIIIPTYNNYESLLKTLLSLNSQTESQFLVHICIDGSTDQTFQKLQEISFTYKTLIHTHPNNLHLGRNATRNLALSHLVSDFIITLDSDSEVFDTFIEEHLKVVKENIVSVGLFQYTNTTSNIWARYLEQRGASKQEHLEEIPYYYFKTGNSCFSKKYFIELQGQDPTMFSYGGGDTEFSIRIQKNYSPTFVYNTKAKATSEMDKTLSNALDQFFEFGARNLHTILQKHPTENKIFSINILLHNRLIHMIMRFPFKTVLTPLVKFFPYFITVKVIHICIASQIVRGYRSKL